MMQAGLTKGWQTWLDMYLEHQRQKRMLAAAAGRTHAPALTAALTHWRDDFVEEQRQALAEESLVLKRDRTRRRATHDLLGRSRGFRASLRRARAKAD